MEWFWLIVAICFEVIGTTNLKLSAGFSKALPTTLTIIFYLVSFWTLAFALKKIEVGIAYAIWSGMGTALIAGIGIIVFGEQLSYLKVISLFLIIAGVIGLNLSGGVH